MTVDEAISIIESDLVTAANVTRVTEPLAPLIIVCAEIDRLRASHKRLRSAIEFAHAEGFQWPSDPMAEFADN